MKSSLYLRRYSQKEKEILTDAIKAFSAIWPASDPIDKVCEFYADMWDLCAEFSEKKTEYGDRGERACVYIRNVAVRYLHLALMIDIKKSDGFLISSIVQTISDTIISIIKLAEDGLEYQAFVMIRTLFELFMTLLIIVESPEKRKAYLSAQTQEDSYKVWRSDFTKGKFIKMLENYSGDYPDLFVPAKKWVTEAYSFLSSFVHNNSLNVMLYTKPKYDQNGNSAGSIWGEYVTRRGEIFNRVVEVVAPCDLVFFSMLNDPKIDISMRTILCDGKDIPDMRNVYWVMENLRKVCLFLLVDHDSHDKIQRELTKVECPFYKEMTENPL